MRRLTASSILIGLVVLAACTSDKPVTAPETTAATPPKPSLSTVHAERTDLLFRYRADDGYQTATQISDIPEAARRHVHVVDLSRTPKERANGWAQIFDLSKDGSYQGRLVRRSELEAALKSAYEAKPKAPQVIMYSTAYCGVCKKAARFMTKNGIAFVEKDIEKDKGAQRELAKKARSAGVQANGVPVFDIGGKIQPGFDPGTLLKMVGKTAKTPI